MRKRTIEDFRKDKIVGKILCPSCKKDNKFRLKERESGNMQFDCLSCGKSTIMPFKPKNTRLR